MVCVSKNWESQLTPTERNDRLIRNQQIGRNSRLTAAERSRIRRSAKKTANAKRVLRKNAKTAYDICSNANELLRKLPKGWTTSHPPEEGKDCIYLPHGADQGYWHRGTVLCIRTCNKHCKYGKAAVDIQRSRYDMRVNPRLGPLVVVPYQYVFLCPPKFRALRPRS
jgi:hypothetical protein